jgi:glycosyltransferase involved in cell wall biosynthesis
VRRCRLGVLASHPIQYFTPLYARLAQQPFIDLEVLYYSDYGVVPRYDREFQQSIKWDVDLLSGYRHRFLRNLSPFRDTFNPLHAFNPGVLPAVLRGYDAIWLNGYTYPSNWLALMAARARSIPVLFRSDMRYTAQRKQGILGMLRRSVIRGWMRRSAAILYIGEDNRRAYLDHGARASELFFTPYSVDVERISRAAVGDRRAFRATWNLPVDAFVLLFVGKMTRRKHPELLIAMLEKLRDVPGVFGLFVGSGQMEQELRQLVKTKRLGNVRFTGFVNQGDLPQLYALSDVFVMPSEDEPWGLVLNEAMVAGAVPIVSAEVGAAADLVKQGTTGFVVEPNDLDGYVRCVRELATNATRRKEMGSAAQALASGYSYDATVGGILRALESLGLIHASYPAPAMAAGAHP